jgi:CHAT domain-containing protein
VHWYGKNKGTESEEYLSAYSNSMLLLCKLGNYATADSMMDAQLVRWKNKMGEKSIAFENAVNKAGIIFMQADNHRKAEEYFKYSITLSRQFNKPGLLMSRLNVLDSLYEEKNITKDRIQVLEEIVALHEAQKLLTDSANAAKLLLLGNTYRRSGFSNKAVSLVPKMDSACRKAYREKTSTFIDSRTIIANIYTDAGMLDKADNYYQQSLKLAATVWKDRKDRYAGLLKVVGEMYNEAGFYKRAEEMLDKAKQWMEESRSTDNNDWSSVLFQLADIKKTMKKTAEAATAYNEAIKYAQKDTALFYQYIMYATLFADFCEDNKMFEKADSLYTEIARRTNNPAKESYSVFLSNLATWSLSKYKSGDTTASFRFIDSVVQLARRFYNNNQTWDDGVLFRLSQYYRLTKQYDKAIYYAEKFYQRELATPGKDDNSLFAIRTILMMACLHAGEYNKAAEIITAMNKSSLQHMLNNLDAFSDAEREKYLFNKIRNIHLSNTLLLRNKDASPSFKKESFNELLLLRSLILAENRKLLESVISGGDTSLQRLYGQWLSARSALSREYAKPVSERRSDILLLEEQAEKLQKDMNQKSALLRNRQQSKALTMDEVQKALQDDEAAIEFVSFAVVIERADSIMYAAHILLKNNPVPVFVPLCTEKQLQKIFDSAGATATSMVNRFYRGIDLGTNNTIASLGKELYNLVWAPLEPHLKGIKKISYSPAGKLFNIAFQALPADNTGLLMDKYEMHQYFSTKQIVSRNEQQPASGTPAYIPKSITLFGNASFSVLNKNFTKQKTLTQGTSGFYLPGSRGTRGNTWTALPGTAEEVKKIKRLFDVNKITAKSFVQTAASEENLKALSGNSPQILHIATHGFFLPETHRSKEDDSDDKNAYTLANDPLLRSGLILSGGNHAWSGKTPVEGVEDGIATAYEISQLNLSNTELVVLSACETALGDVKGSEGVFGLQRAFKMAGVKKMIVSLWQVPDKETAELMTTFYNYWLKGKTIEQAFAQAQAEMRKKYSPYYWAAFVLVE